ncbi:MAG: CPBP family intramembrane metalloprotease [Muribaculaceae bacterium]|nr:CPBP family intramembrane metalloprotease [Muribaculaceae bacterium]
MSENLILKSVRESAGMRLSVLFGSFFILLIISSFLGIIVNQIQFGDARTHALCTSVIQSLLAFCVPALLVAKFSSNKYLEWLELTKAPKLKALFGVLLVYGLSMPAMEWLIQWNAGLHLPESLSGIEETLRNWEDASASATETLLEAHGFWAVTAGVLIIGVLTGFSEELFFRGGLQGIFVRTSVGRNVSVWLAAFIFSCMHFQFFGFLPRLLMGAFFGYLLIWTRCIWVPVFAHVLNNSAVVITSALAGQPSTGLLENDNVSLYLGNSLSVAGSVTLTVLFLVFCRNYLFKNDSKLENPWLRKQLPPVSER